jgi:Zn-dependent protease
MKTLFILLFSGLKWGKIAASGGGGMLLSLAIYATIWGWRYAAGFIALLFAHEMGHYVAARQRGLKVGAQPLFRSWAPGSRWRNTRPMSKQRPTSR